MKNSNTSKSFFDKWSKNRSAFYSETLRENSDTQRWILQRNGYVSVQDWADRLKDCTRILDAGCGNGRVTALLRQLSPLETEVVGIDLVSSDVAKMNFTGVQNIRFEKRDLLSDLSDLGKFDYIYCQEVLHHTNDPERAFYNICQNLKPRGEIAIYVYKEKAPVREYVDDYVRNRIADLPYEQAMEQCRQIAELGRSLSALNLKVKVPTVDVLGIHAGEYDIQRFLYHFFVKCYWNHDITDNENTLINYDWYHPQLASRHTLHEVLGWFDRANIQVVHKCVDHYGITIRGQAK
jgi:SAM-dependent methyltransferase